MSPLVLPVGQRDHVQGSASAPVTLVEYGDFQCPHCRAAHGIIQSLQRHFGHRLRFVFRHFPLTQAHERAEPAAEAAEAAAAHGKFWPMHDAIFTHQDTLEDADLEELAARVGVPEAAVADALARHIYLPRIREDFMSGVRSGVNGTPTFFINGERYDGPYDVACMRLVTVTATGLTVCSND
jgi:protein-disulfide isomerase